MFLAFCIVCPWHFLYYVVYKGCLCKCLSVNKRCLSECLCKYQFTSPSKYSEDKHSKDKSGSTKSSSYNMALELLKKNLRMLWIQYCQSYVIGYTKYDRKIQSVDSIMKSEMKDDQTDGDSKTMDCCIPECRKKNEADNNISTCCCFKYSKHCCCFGYTINKSDGQSNNHEIINTKCPEINMICCKQKFSKRCLLKDIIRVIFFIVKYISQLVTVPLLLLQIFDMYSFLCFSPNSYCSHTTEHNLQLVQAAITLFFYCSLVISHLASTILLWNPWPKDKKVESRPIFQNQSSTTSKKLTGKVKNKVNEIFNDKHPWTIYLLIDLKVVYIITFGFITVVNLISAIANIHASNDKNSMMLLNVSSKHMNVNVTSINDPILWNCRSLSETSNHYKFLYWTVIAVLIVTMGGLFLIKFIPLMVVNSGCGFKCCSSTSSAFKHGLTQLWHIAIHQKLIDILFRAEKDINTQIYDEMLTKDIPDQIVQKVSYWNYFRSIIPYILQFLSFAILNLAYFSFDLHPLACISEPDEELIRYNLKANNVQLVFSTSLVFFQKIGGILVLTLSLTYLLFVKLFFWCTEKVVEDIQQYVEEKDKI